MTLLVALTIVVPITAVGVTVVNLIGNEVERRSFERVRQAVLFAQAVMLDSGDEVTRTAEATARDAQLLAALGAGGLEGELRRLLTAGDLDAIVIADGDGTVVAAARRQPSFAPGVDAPTDEEVVAGDTASTATVASAPLPDGRRLVALRWLDEERVNELARVEGAAVTIVAGGRVVASAGGVQELPDRELEGTFRATFGGTRLLAAAVPIPDSPVTIVTTTTPPGGGGRTNLIVLFAALLVVLVVLVVLVGYQVSGLVTGPVDDLVDAAQAISRGDLDRHVEVSGDVEIATLGRAFNEMTDNLRDYVRQLEESRNQFRSAIARLGDVLVSTHDIAGIVDVVLEAATLTIKADSAVFYERVAMPARIRASAAHGSDVPDVELNGTGIAGAAARTLVPVRAPGEEELGYGEPRVDAALAVPVVSDGRLFGVVAVYGAQGRPAFTDEDADTLQTLVRQAEVAIGNVMLHDETRRQARTDGTTGLWNRREFEFRAREAVKEAERFHDPFGIILCDIDDFKQVNDRYDHSTGDAALIWVASKLSEATREIDVVARWGGEEFIVLLPRAGVEETAIVAERIRALVAREPMEDGNATIPITVSVGYAVQPHDGRSAEQLFKAADAALLRAKRLGKNRVERARSNEGAA